MLNVSVKFQSQPDVDKVKLATSLCQAAATFMKLPDYIEVYFEDMPPNVYGEAIISGRGIDRRIRINNAVPLHGIIFPITHELLHLNQLYEGRLAIARSGTFIWDNKPYFDVHNLSYDDYMNLPWEVDVLGKQPELIRLILG